MKRVDFGSVVATVAARLVLTGAVATTLTVFAQVPEAYAGCGHPEWHAQMKALRDKLAWQKAHVQMSAVSMHATEAAIEDLRDRIQRAMRARAQSGRPFQ